VGFFVAAGLFGKLLLEPAALSSGSFNSLKAFPISGPR